MVCVATPLPRLTSSNHCKLRNNHGTFQPYAGASVVSVSLQYVRSQTIYTIVPNRHCTTRLKSWLFLHIRSGQQPVPFGGQGRTRTYEAVWQRVYSPTELPLSDLPMSVVKVWIRHKTNLLGMLSLADKSPTRIRVVKMFCNLFTGRPYDEYYIKRTHYIIPFKKN